MGLASWAEETLARGPAKFMWNHMGAFDNPVGHMAAGSTRLATKGVGKSAVGLTKAAAWGTEKSFRGGARTANLLDRIPAKRLHQAIFAGAGAYILGKGIVGPMYEGAINEGVLGTPHATAQLAAGSVYGVIDQALMSDARKNAMYQRNTNYNYTPGGHYNAGGDGYAPSGNMVFGMWNLR